MNKSSIAAAAPQQRQKYFSLSRLRSLLGRRTGFWRSLVEMLAVGTIFGLLLYPLSIFPGSPWIEIISFVVYPLIVYNAWRLEPGTGNLFWRAGRVMLWCLLYSAVSGFTSWWVTTTFPLQTSMFGMRSEALQLPLYLYLINMLIITYTLVLPTRTLLTLWHASRRRLRWLLTFSYLLVGVLTIVIVPVVYGLFIGVASLSASPVFVGSDETARRLVLALTPTIERGVTPDELAPVLREMLAGRGQLPLAPDQAVQEVERFNNLAGVRRLTVLAADGRVLASAGREAFAAGEPLPDLVQSRWRLTLDQAQNGCVIARPVDGPLPEASVCPIVVAEAAQPVLVIVENNNDVQMQWGAAFGRVIGITLLGTSLSVTLALPVILVVLLLALAIGLLIARRISKRLELLAQATGGIATGNLGLRVEVDREDEIGHLGADFNAMAARLEERERALAAEAARAEAALQANKRLVANVSHELRTPLTTLRGYIEALEQDYGSQLPAHDLAVINNEVQRLTTLIEDLFTLASAEAEQLPLTIETVDVRELVEKLVSTLAPLARRDRQIELVSALPDALPLVSADRNRLEQVFLNLAQNALRHTPPGGIIAFEAEADMHSVRVTVADTGLGIPDEEIQLVFERFYRGDQSRARETGGAGLGLALARELAEAMGGEINAESTPGRGSRFTVTLRRA